MKKLLLIALALGLYSYSAMAQEGGKESGFVFTTIKENPITSVKDQNRSSTCWSFSSLGFLEAELLRKRKGEYDLAEMFVVHHTMIDRAERYVRLHGGYSFEPGGVFYDAIYCLKHYGIVPQEAMPGIMYSETLPVHDELDAVAKAYVDAIAKGNLKKLTPVWQQGLSTIYDTYLGRYPKNFTYKGKEYTPLSFARSLGLNLDDYVSLTSFTHHPFYSEFAIEIPDNWRNGNSWNLPVDELITVIDNAIEKGFTVAWASDISEQGYTRNGIAVVPDLIRTDLTEAEKIRWARMSSEEKKRELTSKPGPEQEITQEMRQTAFDNWETTDDHGMLIYGIAKDQTGKNYYITKNSWGTKNKYQGVWYASKAFVKYKTINILVHKDAIPKNIARKIICNL
ncbi:Aminopeptidase E [termite gut metagenome]|uniref:Aminopeptidase E n=1 Tax=termite gut metagenome TaxID=433724 RepID=A0A5J4QNV9_9ZZZZ